MIRHSIASIAVAASLAAIATPAAAADFSLTSPDVAEGTSIKPAQYWNSFGCTGENLRPALNWENAPEGTKSYAVTFYDKDAPTGSGLWHWVAYDIPASATGVDGKLEVPAGATAPLTGFFLYQNTIATATLTVTAGPREQ